MKFNKLKLLASLVIMYALSMAAHSTKAVLVIGANPLVIGDSWDCWGANSEWVASIGTQYDITTISDNDREDNYSMEPREVPGTGITHYSLHLNEITAGAFSQAHPDFFDYIMCDHCVSYSIGDGVFRALLPALKIGGAMVIPITSHVMEVFDVNRFLQTDMSELVKNTSFPRDEDSIVVMDSCSITRMLKLQPHMANTPDEEADLLQQCLDVAREKQIGGYARVDAVEQKIVEFYQSYTKQRFELYMATSGIPTNIHVESNTTGIPYIVETRLTPPSHYLRPNHPLECVVIER
ncbi:MAG: hypothetical protein LBJ69_02680 [Holosporales bacterium]|jgi:hypothetical protein|nr:hypothetical protein [Holosporales bacterium]